LNESITGCSGVKGSPSPDAAGKGEKRRAGTTRFRQRGDERSRVLRMALEYQSKAAALDSGKLPDIGPPPSWFEQLLLMRDAETEHGREQRERAAGSDGQSTS
jgi:hypothetical protein